MSFSHRFMLRAAALALPALLFAASAQAGDEPSKFRDQDRTVGFGAQSEDLGVPSAPVGHRQPRAADIPANVPRDGSDAWLNQLNRDTDRKLQICRNC
jgi:hypothetical protein